ncbi:MAG: hypothetical protein AAFW69_10145, partial [Pseudomonadota bacterium]
RRSGGSGAGEEGERAAFLARMAETPHSRVILSSETFCYLRQETEREALATFLAPHFDRIVPVLVLRERTSWERSWRAQLRGMRVLKAVAELPEGDRVIDAWYFDRERLVAFWQAFGAPAVIDYDATMAAEGSILPAFLRSCALADLDLRQTYFANVTRTS